MIGKKKDSREEEEEKKKEIEIMEKEQLDYDINCRETASWADAVQEDGQFTYETTGKGKDRLNFAVKKTTVVNQPLVVIDTPAPTAAVGAVDVATRMTYKYAIEYLRGILNVMFHRKRDLHAHLSDTSRYSVIVQNDPEKQTCTVDMTLVWNGVRGIKTTSIQTDCITSCFADLVNCFVVDENGALPDDGDVCPRGMYSQREIFEFLVYLVKSTAAQHSAITKALLSPDNVWVTSEKHKSLCSQYQVALVRLKKFPYVSRCAVAPVQKRGSPNLTLKFCFKEALSAIIECM